MIELAPRLNGDALTRRLNTIATNAIREAQIALGRGDKPWIDDDWRRSSMISQILNLAQLEEIDVMREHYPLTASVQAPKNSQLDMVEKKLAEALEVEIIDAQNIIKTAKLAPVQTNTPNTPNNSKVA
jgi:hypothetical protein